MTIRCRICGIQFREEDEIQATMFAYWHELGSRVHFSLSKPHDCDTETLAHRSCVGRDE